MLRLIACLVGAVTVQLFWTLTVTDPEGKVLDTGVEDGLDVFRRQPDDTWKIHVSHAFTK